MTRQVTYVGRVAVGLSLALSAVIIGRVHSADAQEASVPVVFQAAGPTAASIQSMVDAFRTAIGGANNGNVTGPIVGGRREINWDGGGSTATSLVPTPFDGFLVTRGGRFTTPGSGFVQAPADGLAATFNNFSYTNIFRAFSPVRLFSPLENNQTTAHFFVPGGGEIPATTSAFGAVFSDVDQQIESQTFLLFYDVNGSLLAKTIVPASRGDASLSFFGVIFDRSSVGSVRITTGNAAPGPNDILRRDIVVMDDFIYAEPQAVVN